MLAMGAAMHAETEPRPSPAAWPTLVERVVRCPVCHAEGVGQRSTPKCPSCGFEATWNDGIPSYVKDEWLHEGHEAEVTAQTAAVDSYYENEQRLTCHWDRLSADELPGFLGWPSGLVLDLGCGTGTAGAALRRSGAQVVGADLSQACLSVARRRLDAVRPGRSRSGRPRPPSRGRTWRGPRRWPASRRG